MVQNCELHTVYGAKDLFGCDYEILLTLIPANKVSRVKHRLILRLKMLHNSPEIPPCRNCKIHVRASGIGASNAVPGINRMIMTFRSILSAGVCSRCVNNKGVQYKEVRKLIKLELSLISHTTRRAESQREHSKTSIRRAFAIFLYLHD